MPFTIAKEDGAYKCSQCGHVLAIKKGQMLPPCPRCGATMEKSTDPPAGQPSCA